MIELPQDHLLELRKTAAQYALAPVLADPTPMDGCWGCIIDAAIGWEEYLLNGTNSKHKHEDLPVNLDLVEE
jgi:hypothetical protein